MIRLDDIGAGPIFALTDRIEGGRAVWAVAAPLTFERITAGRIAHWLTVPRGFETDGASIPWWSRAWLDPWSRIGLAAVLHDYLLTLPLVEKWEADLAFMEALRSFGAPAFLSTLLYFAVRLRRRPTAQPSNTRSKP